MVISNFEKSKNVSKASLVLIETGPFAKKISSLSCLRKIKEGGQWPLPPELRGPVSILMG